MSPSRPRAGRATPPGEASGVRRRDPERTKAALLAAALAEFAEKGVAGARVDEIAARAGVNKQLISYYFGGKAGLHDALSEEWRIRDQGLTDLSLPLEDVVAGILAKVYDDRDRLQFSIRESLDRDPADVSYEPNADDVDNLRRRGEAGEFSADLDPAFVLLVLQGAVLSGALFPGDTKRMLGLDPGSPEYIAFMSEQLRRLVRRLGAAPSPS